VPSNRKQHGQETTYRSNSRREVVGRAGGLQERVRIRRRADVMRFPRRISTAGSTKRNREQRQRLGGESLPGRKPRRIAASGNWNGAGAGIAGDRDPKKRRGGVICGEVHSLAPRGYTARLVAATLAISRSSLYYPEAPTGQSGRPNYDEQIVVACGEKPA
jgi:hypothetical protein